MSEHEARSWVLAAPAAVLAAARPLVEAHARHRPVRLVARESGRPAGLDELAEWADGAAGLLVCSDGRWAPRSALPGPFVTSADGRQVPVGWVPAGGRGHGLGAFVAAAARVAARPANAAATIAILAQWVPRYLQLAERLDHYLPAQTGRLRWSADRITRDDVAQALRLGLGAAVYFGHGRPSGWAAYHGVRAHHLVTGGEPLGAVISMTCYTASRWRVGTSFAEQVVLGGAAAASVGAVAPVEHLDNARWMIGLAAALAEGQTAVGPALCAALPAGPSPYRIVGDPLAALLGTPAGWSAALAVAAPPPDTQLYLALKGNPS
ncbi:C25 family cysteine peptidase [Jatrophihabitans sp.]|uniref:C25 family cysteine peptidase n=1 Tax=Jatrophihabitans sp. TaxID=1932789 RepID=UPI0030C6AE12|nr:hypothetical protein [Jatrophihabitans sp.]